MKTGLFIVNATDLRGWDPKPVWLAQAVRSVNGLALRTRVEVPEHSDFDVAAIYRHGARAAVIHFLGYFDSDGKRLLFFRR